MTPVEELRAAATKLRETAEKACGGPWENTDDLLWIGGSVWGYSIPKTEFLPTGADPAWIALMHPGLAVPLALLLEDQAAMYEDFLPRGADIAERIVWHGLGVARSINGGAS